MRKIQKWSAIARTLEEQYGVGGRSAKQCRERYSFGNESRWHNSLDPNIRNDTWSEQEEERLFQLHNQYGNRWAKISELLPGRTDNSIKNHFYCTLRKALRRVNRYISDHKHRLKIRQIKNSILSKAIAVAEEKFESKLVVPEGLVEACCSIKNRLLQFAKVGDLTAALEVGLRQLITDIGDFNRSYKKKKSKKKRRDEPKAGNAVLQAQESDEEDENNDEDTDNVHYPDQQQLDPSLSKAVQISSEVPVKDQLSVKSPVVSAEHGQSLFVSMKQYNSAAVTISSEQNNKVSLSRSMEFQIEDFLKGGGSNNYGKDSPSFLPLSPPRFPDSIQQPLSPSYRNPYESGSFENPYTTLLGDTVTTKLRPTIVLKELPRVEKTISLGSPPHI